MHQNSRSQFWAPLCVPHYLLFNLVSVTGSATWRRCKRLECLKK
jgi:hypothetical protein